MQNKNFRSGQNILLKQYDLSIENILINDSKYVEFKKRIKRFKDVQTLDEAKQLAIEILPVANEINMFSVGSGKCYVINREDNFRITLESANEFISYDFV